MSTKNKEARSFLESRVGPLTVGKLLGSIRMSEGISQVEFATNLGISKSHLCDIEQDRKNLSLERAVTFAKILGYPKEQFVRLALQGLLDKEDISMTVSVKAA